MVYVKDINRNIPPREGEPLGIEEEEEGVPVRLTKINKQETKRTNNQRQTINRVGPATLGSD